MGGEISPAALGDDVLVSGTVGKATFVLLVPWRAHGEGCNVAAGLRCGTSSLIAPLASGNAPERALQLVRVSSAQSSASSWRLPMIMTLVCECTRVRKVRDRAARTGRKDVIEMLNLKGYMSGRSRRASGGPRVKRSSARS